MAIQHNPNLLVDVLKTGLETEVKKQITEEYVTEKVVQFEQELRESIKPLIDSWIIKDVEQFRNAMKIQEEVAVMLKWEDSDE